ncbi:MULTISPECIES: cyclic pyranopterin monophosphate synthase MoaC [unclassified Fusibacter]|uniref:cyclic pyranopterin monophosphate synthase MoaC n=1 Tax=unclassified Fusibacter TaxID=2624464 RepID=UPI001011DB0F|nr:MULTISPECIES: cyclic pyranopterin monophosphate synthase MoaC [unclassified Fusibacter]MCK8061128.1 cyclic pyranopterin monophosphate synthase MoaC [Fusibacter sp. A2]NPE23336.1 cyclic pyranopterin monophosphate synthase MoaC [Fusibacter sp. A1]RXV59379.1 cyclic pyranopterin monophosphate synthase MoaC [Fusibacter sp. A1]
MPLTHINEAGYAKMVSVDEKTDSLRTAIATGEIVVSEETFRRVKNGGVKKGDVITVAQIAGIMGAKRTSDIIPMCHPLNLTGADLSFDLIEAENTIRITATVKVMGKTGVEMEALTAVSVAALTIYDMCKAIDKDMVIQNIYLKEKIGGKSGHYIKNK